MVDITVDNFEEMWPFIQKNIDQSVIIGFDSEFSGISSSAKLHWSSWMWGSTPATVAIQLMPAPLVSLFDSMPERYSLQREAISPFIITQFGLTAIVQGSKPGTFVAHPYNFYLFPHSIGRLDMRFCCQASSFEFLRRHNFDFNKFICSGIPFLNQEDELLLREDIRTDRMRGEECRLSVDEHFLQDACSSVSRWLSEPAGGQQPWTIDVTEMSLRYLVQKELRRSFHDIWTSSDGRKVLVTRVATDLRRELEVIDDDLDERFVTSLVGFTRVMRHLSQTKKPIVGHNCLLDLMLIHSLFIGPLPSDYKRFKSTIHSWFPEVYDTKHVAHFLRNVSYGEAVALSANSLQGLHEGLGSHAMRTCVLYAPVIQLAGGASRYEEAAAHEAGYDSYMASSCCLHMAHLIAHKDATSTEQHRPLGATELIGALASAKNHVNVIRGAVNYMSLDGADPLTERPRWFHLTYRGGATLHVPEIVEMLAQYGTVDVRPYSARQALIAVGNYPCAKDVVGVFRRDKRYTISQYSALKHSPLVRTLLWSGVVVSTGLGALLLFSQCRRPTT